MRYRIPAAVAVSLALTATATLPATAATKKKPTIVLVHGAFADASGWGPAIQRLKKAGYPVIAPANPLRTLSGDAAYLSSVLDTLTGPVILVGHSYGGMVISNAAVGHKNVKALVYIAAFAPAKGESALDLSGKNPGSKLPKAILPRPTPDGGIDAYINPAKFRSVFAADLPKKTTDVMAATQRPVTLAALSSPSTAAAWTSFPSWYLIAGRDNAIPPKTQRFMAARANAHTFTAPKSSHAVFLSKPTLTVSVIKAAAGTS